MIAEQLELFELFDEKKTQQPKFNLSNLPDYDRIILAFSGGKDSLAALLFLLELGCTSKIELWHHLVDGDKNAPNFFDWHCTHDYCLKLAQYLGLPIYFSYREGGFKGEMLRENQSTGRVWFELPDGTLQATGGKGKPNTRKKFPMPTASLQTRWCSSYLKISVMDTAIRNQERFNDGKTLVITGERREESAARAKYLEFEPHRTNSKMRLVDHWRPVIEWKREEIWRIIQKHGIIPHPAYYLGFSRTSCRNCIFLQQDDLSTLYSLNPKQLEEIANYEESFGYTIGYDKQREKKGLPQLTVVDKARQGTPRKVDLKWVKAAWSKTWDLPLSVSPDDWELPIGAYSRLDSGSP